MKKLPVSGFLLAIAVTACAAAKPKPFTPQYLRSTVSLAETRSNDTQRFRVQGAVGRELDDLQKVAHVDAVVAAARSLAGEKSAQDRAEQAVTGDVVTYEPLGQTVQQLATRQTPDGENMQGDVLVDVNVARLRTLLEKSGAITSEKKLSKAAANARILVIPEGIKPGTQLKEWVNVVTANINSFIVRKGWELVDANAVEEARARAMKLDAASGNSTDPVAAIAMEAGAEIYVTWDLTFDGKQANSGIKAFETVGGRLLSSATGRSKNYMTGSTSGTTIVEEAVSNALPELIENITTKWTEALSEGHRVAIQLSGDFSGPMKKQVREALKAVGDFDETNKTKNSLHGVLSTKLSVSDLEDELESAFKDAGIADIDPVVTSKVLVRWHLGAK
jgi:hypothetical protein